MIKNLKLKIKNTQLAEILQRSNLGEPSDKEQAVAAEPAASTPAHQLSPKSVEETPVGTKKRVSSSRKVEKSVVTEENKRPKTYIIRKPKVPAEVVEDTGSSDDLPGSLETTDNLLHSLNIEASSSESDHALLQETLAASTPVVDTISHGVHEIDSSATLTPTTNDEVLATSTTHQSEGARGHFNSSSTSVGLGSGVGPRAKPGMHFERNRSLPARAFESASSKATDSRTTHRATSAKTSGTVSSADTDAGTPSSAVSRSPRVAPVLRESFSARQARLAREGEQRFQENRPTTIRPRLGPTGKHFRDLIAEKEKTTSSTAVIPPPPTEKVERAISAENKKKGDKISTVVGSEEETSARAKRTFDRTKPSKAVKKGADRPIIESNRLEEETVWRKKRPAKRSPNLTEDLTVRPSALTIRLPITIKDLAQEMKLKASQLVTKLFLQGMSLTLNDLLDDETTVQLLGDEFGCIITVDRREDERVRITNKSVADEIAETVKGRLQNRPPVVAFMGHVDHGKTSLVDAIRKSNRVASEAGAITQHIGAFSCQTAQGELTILDTPGHEAFAAMRQRGARLTDVIVLVVAGDEGVKPQTDEAIRHAKTVGATILVAINKCDKPHFNIENVYRQLAERDLLPEVWGGTIVTVACSAVTGQGIQELLEMIALQSQVLELRADPEARARGSVIEAQLHKGLGNVATVLVQNGTLRQGDALVFTQSWGRVKTMRDEFDLNVQVAPPSHAVRITGLSSLPEAGEDFIVVASEKEAREIAEIRADQIREHQSLQRKKLTLESLMQQSQGGKKVLHCILRADVQGSVEALRFEILKIHSEKLQVNIVSEGIGEVCESDVQLAAASGAVIIGFHTRVEAHAEELIKRYHVKVSCYDVIYHAVDGVKEMMIGLLDKVAQEQPKGKALVKAVFRSSQLGKIAGCQVSEGSITRGCRVRLHRKNKVIWEGVIASLRRDKDDVKEVHKGFECGILLQGFDDFEPDDQIEAYEIIYLTQGL